MSYINPLNFPTVFCRSERAREGFEIEVIAFHGWGFDRHCWQFWQKQFTQLGGKFQAFDRGYFGYPVQPNFTNSNSTKVILVHSYGLHLCPIDLLQQADLLIAFNSFLSFHPKSRSEKRRSQLVLQQMIRQFEQTPKTVLQNFYEQSGCSQLYPDFRQINHHLLLRDLQQLNVSTLDPCCLNSIAKVIVFYSSDDRIVAASQTQEFLVHLPHPCELIHVPQAGHALPFSQAVQCWSLLQPVRPVTS